MKIVQSGGRVITLSKVGTFMPSSESKLQDILSSFFYILVSYRNSTICDVPSFVIICYVFLYELHGWLGQ